MSHRSLLTEEVGGQISSVGSLSLLGKNTCIYAVGNVIVRLSSFLLIPLYTHLLSVEDFGLLAGIFVLIQIMISLMGVKTREGVIRFFTEAEEQERVGSLLCSSLIITIAGGVIVSFVALFFLADLIALLLKTNGIKDLVLIACGVAFGQSLSMNLLSYYRARNDGKRFVLASIGSFLLVFVLTVALLVGIELGILGALLAQAVGYLAIATMVWFDIFSTEYYGFSSTQILELLRYGSPLVLGNLGDHAITSSGIFLLGYLTSLEVVAIYSLGFRIAGIVGNGLILPFQMAFEPFVFANLQRPQIRATISTLLTYLMFLCVFVTFGVAVFAKDLIQLMAPEEYASAYLVVVLVLPAIAFRGVYYFGEALLHIRKKTYVTGTIVLTLGVFSLLFNYVLISWIGLYGAALAFDLIVISLGTFALVLGMRAYPIPLEVRRLLLLAVLMVLLLGAVVMLSGFSGSTYYTVLGALGLISVGGLYMADFFNGREVSAIKGAWYQLRASLA